MPWVSQDHCAYLSSVASTSEHHHGLNLLKDIQSKLFFSLGFIPFWLSPELHQPHYLGDWALVEHKTTTALEIRQALVFLWTMERTAADTQYGLSQSFPFFLKITPLTSFYTWRSFAKTWDVDLMIRFLKINMECITNNVPCTYRERENLQTDTQK